MNCFVTGRRRRERGAQMVRFWNNSECASPIWTKIGTTKQLDTKNKPVMYFLKILEIDLTRGGQRSKFGLFWPNFTPMRSIFGITRNASVQFWHNLVQWHNLTLGTSLDGRLRFGQRSKIDQIWPYKLHFGSAQITFWLIIWIRFIQFGPNLADRY